MALTGTNLSKTDIVADQKIYASSETTRIDIINNFIDECVAKCVLKEDAQSIAGLKTFTTIPKIPTTTPTTDEQVASKKYVDDREDAIFGSFRYKDVTIINNTTFSAWHGGSPSANTWYPMDVASEASITAQRMVCMFELSSGSTTNTRYRMLEYTAGNDGASSGGDTGNSVNQTTVDSSYNVPKYLICLTDTNGKILYATDSVSQAHTLKLKAYWILAT